MHLTAAELLHLTDEQRERWESWFRENGEELLRMPIAGQGEKTVGALIVNVFSFERRTAQRVRGEALADSRSRPSERIAELFGFGLESRKLMREFVEQAAAEEWTRVLEFAIDGRTYRSSTRKTVLHALLHEVQAWAQVARIMRDHGFEPPADDGLLGSSALL